MKISNADLACAASTVSDLPFAYALQTLQRTKILQQKKAVLSAIGTGGRTALSNVFNPRVAFSTSRRSCRKAYDAMSLHTDKMPSGASEDTDRLINFFNRLRSWYLFATSTTYGS